MVFILAKTALCLVAVLFSFYLKPFKCLFQGIWEFYMDIIKLRNFQFTSCWLYVKKDFIITHYRSIHLSSQCENPSNLNNSPAEQAFFLLANHSVVDFCFSLRFVCCSRGSRLNSFHLVPSLPSELEGMILSCSAESCIT